MIYNSPRIETIEKPLKRELKQSCKKLQIPMDGSNFYISCPLENKSLDCNSDASWESSATGSVILLSECDIFPFNGSDIHKPQQSKIYRSFEDSRIQTMVSSKTAVLFSLQRFQNKYLLCIRIENA
ncbi:hypothetical protein AVEN_256144-1 [Araneus ventricosus]|uniref:Uncharacterized protein n=1 Tax=Araneus ventricosus TaxID=182803 RepID=A0A4Y2SW00_ARAVE|nr:hypothetical protein AVEN_133412-1 [Araneus ventricosus]GBN91365.1 hypothetical protein AVEN_256144-1 [Araneus ventricosus]